MRGLRLWATILLGTSVAAGILNLTTLRDGEVASAVALGATIAVAILVAARPRKGIA